MLPKKAKLKSGIVVIRNKKIVKVYIQKDSLSKTSEYYKSFMTEDEFNSLIKSANPQLYFGIVKDETFSKQLDDWYKENPAVQQLLPNYDDEAEWFSIIANILPILLILLVFILMMRKVGGPGGGGGSG